MILHIVTLITLSMQRDAAVIREAQKINFPINFALSVSHVENWRGIPDAVSDKGAIGIMQVMPIWNGTFIKDCGTLDDLTDVDYNACIGVHILRFYGYRCHHQTKCILEKYSHTENLPEQAKSYEDSFNEYMRRLS